MPKHRRRDTTRHTTHRPRALTPRPYTPISPEPPLLLKVTPPLHRDLRAVELAVLVVATLVRTRDGTSGLSRVTPTEVVKVPERVSWQDEVPDWEGEQVDEHPKDVDEAVGGDDNEDTWEAKDKDEED
jgi:hypothetical protein